jgi:hypothetical protein
VLRPWGYIFADAWRRPAGYVQGMTLEHCRYGYEAAGRVDRFFGSGVDGPIAAIRSIVDSTMQNINPFVFFPFFKSTFCYLSAESHPAIPRAMSAQCNDMNGCQEISNET